MAGPVSTEGAAARVVLVTGAASGIGAALARRMAGGDVALMLHSRGADDHGRERLSSVAQKCREAGASVETAACDLAAPGAGADLVARTIAAFGGLDHIVHNAGFADRRLIGEVTRADLDRSFAAMPGAFFDIVTAALAPLSRSPRGRVVAVSSFVAHRFVREQLFPVSAAAKAALEALAKSLAAQLAGTATTVNLVVPGFTRKDPGKLGTMSMPVWEKAALRNPQQRLAEPADIASAIMFLLSDEAGHITGEALHVDGGLTLG